jgi:hypothetical protein
VAATAAATAAGACVVGDLVLLAGLLVSTVFAGGVAWPAALVAGRGELRAAQPGRPRRTPLPGPPGGVGGAPAGGSQEAVSWASLSPVVAGEAYSG